MNVLTAALLGLIQGLAEFLPISSSGHLNLLQALFGVDVEHQLLFNILLHVGTLVAVAIVFWKDWVAMIAHPIKNHTLALLFIASLPALAGKILFDKPLDYVETHNSLLGVCFLITALLLVLTQWLSRRNALRGVEKHRVGVGEALAMGCLQAVGMLPGVSTKTIYAKATKPAADKTLTNAYAGAPKGWATDNFGLQMMENYVNTAEWPETAYSDIADYAISSWAEMAGLE